MSTDSHSSLSNTQSMPERMHLNYDVLVLLLSHLDKMQDLLSLMTTCHDMRAAGIPYLFRPRLEMCSDTKLRSLCRFLLADAPDRLSLLKQLAVQTYPDDTETVELYLEVLQRAPHLEDIEIWCGLPSIDSRIQRAISNLTTIHTITIRNLLYHEAALLKTMKSPVRKVDISFQYYDQPVDPVWLLEKFAPTLQTLRVVLGYQQRDTTTVVYPCMHTLVAESCIFEKTGPLIKAYPNLQDLTIFSYRDEESMDQVAADRRVNQQAQREQCWGPMERLSGDVLMLYRLGLCCTVRRLEIPWLENTGADSWTPSFKNMFSSVLSDARPSTLSLILRPAVYDMNQFPAFLSAVPEELEKLVMTLYITGTTDASKVLECIFAAVHAVRITHLVLRLKWYDSRKGPAAEDPHRTELYLKRTDPRELAQLAMEISPSLQYFFVELAGQEMGYWHLDRQAPHEDTLQRLSVEAATAIMGEDSF